MRVHLVWQAVAEHLRKHPQHHFAVITQEHASCGDCDTSYERTTLNLTVIRCTYCQVKLGVSYSIVTGLYCDEMCYRRDNHGKRKLKDNPQA